MEMSQTPVVDIEAIERASMKTPYQPDKLAPKVTPSMPAMVNHMPNHISYVRTASDNLIPALAPALDGPGYPEVQLPVSSHTKKSKRHSQLRPNLPVDSSMAYPVQAMQVAPAFNHEEPQEEPQIPLSFWQRLKSTSEHIMQRIEYVGEVLADTLGVTTSRYDLFLEDAQEYKRMVIFLWSKS